MKIETTDDGRVIVPDTGPLDEDGRTLADIAAVVLRLAMRRWERDHGGAPIHRRADLLDDLADALVTQARRPADFRPRKSGTTRAARWLTTGEAAGLLRVSPRQVVHLIRDGHLAGAERNGAGPWQIPPEAIDTYKERRQCR